VKISLFWVVTPCSTVEFNIDQTTQRNNSEDRNLNTYRPDDGGSMISETLVNIDQTTQRNNSEDRNLHTYALMMEAL
jgi:hypothetical protein